MSRIRWTGLRAALVGVALVAAGVAGVGSLKADASGGRAAALEAGMGTADTATLAAEVAGGVRADPLAEFSTHVVATHYLRGRAYDTHHYFKPLRDGVLQGLVFREEATGAPLVEVEWAIGQAIFDQLPDWQKDYWHPLAPAVAAGRVRLPGLDAAAEREMLQTVAGLYAQTINLAGIDGELPIGLEGVAMVTHLTRQEMLQALHP